LSRRRRSSELLPASAEAPRGVPRRLRVERQVHERLASAIAALRDPALGSVNITRVSMTDDLRLARVYVRVGVELEADNVQRRRVLMRGLERASGRLRRELGSALGLRYTPELRFQYDDGEDAARRVDELLAEIRDDS
jgi:ribosome-binding factor A